MYLRIRRQRFDSLPDIIVTEATKINAPMIQQTTGQHLTVVYVSGGQLSQLKQKLKGEASVSSSFRERPETAQLLSELAVCSKLFVVSTTVELVIASDRSRESYKVLEGLYENLMPDYAAFSDGCTVFIAGLQDLPA